MKNQDERNAEFCEKLNKLILEYTDKHQDVGVVVGLFEKNHEDIETYFDLVILAGESHNVAKALTVLDLSEEIEALKLARDAAIKMELSYINSLTKTDIN